MRLARALPVLMLAHNDRIDTAAEITTNACGVPMPLVFDPPLVAEGAPRSLPSAPRKRSPRAYDRSAETTALFEAGWGVGVGVAHGGDRARIEKAIAKRARRAAKRRGGR